MRTLLISGGVILGGSICLLGLIALSIINPLVPLMCGSILYFSYRHVKRTTRTALDE